MARVTVAELQAEIKQQGEIIAHKNNRIESLQKELETERKTARRANRLEDTLRISRIEISGLQANYSKALGVVIQMHQQFGNSLVPSLAVAVREVLGVVSLGNITGYGKNGYANGKLVGEVSEEDESDF